MVSGFKELNLDRTQLENCIQKYCNLEHNRRLISYAPVNQDNNSYYRIVYQQEDIECERAHLRARSDIATSYRSLTIENRCE